MKGSKRHEMSKNKMSKVTSAYSKKNVERPKVGKAQKLRKVKG